MVEALPARSNEITMGQPGGKDCLGRQTKQEYSRVPRKNDSLDYSISRLDLILDFGMRPRIITWFALSAFSLGTFAAAAESEVQKPTYLIRSWKTEDGLPHNTVNTILQAHDGHLWIGTTCPSKKPRIHQVEPLPATSPRMDWSVNGIRVERDMGWRKSRYQCLSRQPDSTHYCEGWVIRQSGFGFIPGSRGTYLGRN